MDDYYTYVLMDPRKPGPFSYTLSGGRLIKFNHEPFYVGKGCGKRSLAHLKAPLSDQSFKARKIRNIQRAGLEVIVQHSRKLFSEERAFAYERELISCIGRQGISDGPLTNRCAGGEGSAGHRRSKRARSRQAQSLSTHWQNMTVEEYERRVSVIRKATQDWWNSATEEQIDQRRASSREATLKSLASLSAEARALRFVNVRAANLRPENLKRLRDISVAGVEAAKRKLAAMTSAEYTEWVQWRAEQRRNRSEEAKASTVAKYRATIASLPKIKCPHCDKIGSPLAMPRWHFDNCKQRKKREKRKATAG